VVRNWITDLFRRRKAVNLAVHEARDRDSERVPWKELLPSPDSDPEAAYARAILLEELEVTLAELPAEQLQVFLAHEFEGRSFKDLAESTGAGANTLLAQDTTRWPISGRGSRPFATNSPRVR
jgi:DNA-directed RNA polymerase specialized sigma24 family protein